MNKQPNPFWSLDPSKYQPAINWLHDKFRGIGYTVVEARFDPDRGVWMLYDDEGQLVGVFEHETIERISAEIDACDQHLIDQQIDAVTKDKKGW